MNRAVPNKDILRKQRTERNGTCAYCEGIPVQTHERSKLGDRDDRLGLVQRYSASLPTTTGRYMSHLRSQVYDSQHQYSCSTVPEAVSGSTSQIAQKRAEEVA